MLGVNNPNALVKELGSYPGISGMSFVGSIMLPAIVYVATEGDLYIFLMILFAVTPSAFMLGFLWFRFLDYLVVCLKKYVGKLLNRW